MIALLHRSSAFTELEILELAEPHGVYEMNQEYTTIIPQARQSHKRNRNGEFLQSIGHAGWLHIDSTVDLANQRFVDYLERNNEETIEQLDLSTFFDSLRDCDELASDLHCRCQGPCDSFCSCKRNRRRCTSLCECTIGIHSHLGDCANLRPRRTHLEENQPMTTDGSQRVILITMGRSLPGAVPVGILLEIQRSSR
jgi:hypothetical protein